MKEQWKTNHKSVNSKSYRCKYVQNGCTAYPIEQYVLLLMPRDSWVFHLLIGKNTGKPKVTLLFQTHLTCLQSFDGLNQSKPNRFSFTKHSPGTKAATFYVFFLFTVGLSNTSLTPAAFCLKNLLFWALSWAHAESNDVVSWSTRWVYLVRPDRPKFLTWLGVKMCQKRGNISLHVTRHCYSNTM